MRPVLVLRPQTKRQWEPSRHPCARAFRVRRYHGLGPSCFPFGRAEEGVCDEVALKLKMLENAPAAWWAFPGRFLTPLVSILLACAVDSDLTSVFYSVAASSGGGIISSLSTSSTPTCATSPTSSSISTPRRSAGAFLGHAQPVVPPTRNRQGLRGRR
jgi:hypothetical protein